MADLGSRIAALRLTGWSVAVHNDYRQHGGRFTFWLFTKPTPGSQGSTGAFVKGEGATDHAAVERCWELAQEIDKDG